MTTFSLEKELKENSYPGRGIVILLSASHAASAVILQYFFLIFKPLFSEIIFPDFLLLTK